VFIKYKAEIWSESEVFIKYKAKVVIQIQIKFIKCGLKEERLVLSEELCISAGFVG